MIALDAVNPPQIESNRHESKQEQPDDSNGREDGERSRESGLPAAAWLPAP